MLHSMSTFGRRLNNINAFIQLSEHLDRTCYILTAVPIGAVALSSDSYRDACQTRGSRLSFAVLHAFQMQDDHTAATLRTSAAKIARAKETQVYLPVMALNWPTTTTFSRDSTRNGMKTQMRKLGVQFLKKCIQNQ